MPLPGPLPLLAVASVKYKSPHKGDLTFAKGETVRILALAPAAETESDGDDSDDDEWFVGESLDHARHGTFPGGLVAFLPPEQQPEKHLPEPEHEPEHEPEPVSAPVPVPVPETEPVLHPRERHASLQQAQAPGAATLPLADASAPAPGRLQAPAAALASASDKEAPLSSSVQPPPQAPAPSLLDHSSSSSHIELAKPPSGQPSYPTSLPEPGLMSKSIPETTSEPAQQAQLSDAEQRPTGGESEATTAAQEPESKLDLPSPPGPAAHAASAHGATAVAKEPEEPSSALASDSAVSTAAHPPPSASLPTSSSTSESTQPPPVAAAKPPPTVPKKSNALRDRIAAFNKPAELPLAPPVHRTGAGWKRPPPPAGEKPVRPTPASGTTNPRTPSGPAPVSPAASTAPASTQVPPPASPVSPAVAQPTSSTDASSTTEPPGGGGFSAADAKSSIKMSLKERMAALQRGGANDGDPSSPPTPARAPPPPAPKPGRLTSDRRAAALAGIGTTPATPNPTSSSPEVGAQTGAQEAPVEEPEGTAQGQHLPAVDEAQQPSTAESPESTEMPGPPESSEPAEPTEEEKEAAAAAERKATILRRLQTTGGMKIGAPPPPFGAPAPKPTPARHNTADEGTTEEDPLFGSDDEQKPKPEEEEHIPEEPEEDEATRKAKIVRRLQAGGGMNMFGAPAVPASAPAPPRPSENLSPQEPEIPAASNSKAHGQADGEETTQEEGLFDDEDTEVPAPSPSVVSPAAPVAKPSLGRPAPPRRVAPPRRRETKDAAAPTAEAKSGPAPDLASESDLAGDSLSSPVQQDTKSKTGVKPVVHEDASAPMVPAGKPSAPASAPAPPSIPPVASSEPLGVPQRQASTASAALSSSSPPLEFHDAQLPAHARGETLLAPPAPERRESSASALTAPLGEDELVRNQDLLDQFLAGPSATGLSAAAPGAGRHAQEGNAVPSLADGVGVKESLEAKQDQDAKDSAPSVINPSSARSPPTVPAVPSHAAPAAPPPVNPSSASPSAVSSSPTATATAPAPPILGQTQNTSAPLPPSIRAPKPRMAEPRPFDDDDSEEAGTAAPANPPPAHQPEGEEAKQDELSEEQEERERRSRIAQRLARLGGQKIGTAPLPMGGMGAPMPPRAREPIEDSPAKVEHESPGETAERPARRGIPQGGVAIPGFTPRPPPVEDEDATYREAETAAPQEAQPREDGEEDWAKNATAALRYAATGGAKSPPPPSGAPPPPVPVRSMSPPAPTRAPPRRPPSIPPPSGAAPLPPGTPPISRGYSGSPAPTHAPPPIPRNAAASPPPAHAPPPIPRNAAASPPPMHPPPPPPGQHKRLSIPLGGLDRRTSLDRRPSVDQKTGLERQSTLPPKHAPPLPPSAEVGEANALGATNAAPSTSVPFAPSHTPPSGRASPSDVLPSPVDDGGNYTSFGAAGASDPLASSSSPALPQGSPVMPQAPAQGVQRNASTSKRFSRLQASSGDYLMPSTRWWRQGTNPIHLPPPIANRTDVLIRSHSSSERNHGRTMHHIQVAILFEDYSQTRMYPSPLALTPPLRFPH